MLLINRTTSCLYFSFLWILADGLKKWNFNGYRLSALFLKESFGLWLTILYQDHCSRLNLLILGDESIIFYSLVLIDNTR